VADWIAHEGLQELSLAGHVPRGAKLGTLAESQSRRIHRDALVNVNHVRMMSALSSQRSF
jgi:hypothetical protein